MNDSFHIGESGLTLVKHFEGCRLVAYWDPFGEIWTIGWGHTSGVYEGQTITQEQADTMLQQDLVVYENYVKEFITVELQQYEFDALTSFCYNAGGGSLQGTIANLINSGNKTGAMDELMNYVHDNNGNVVEGLVTRRTAEKDLFLNNSLATIGGGTGDTGGGGSGSYKLKSRYLYGFDGFFLGRKIHSLAVTFTLVSTTGDIAIITDGKNQYKINKKNLIQI